MLASFSEYRADFVTIETLFKERGIAYELLQGTKDIWCRDYMPVRRPDGQLVQFRYEPAYLNGFEHLRSDVREINLLHGLDPIYSDINLDGGNVLFRGNRVLISDRVIRENPQYTERYFLIGDLEALLDASVLLVPQINSDMTGHVDGYMRWHTDDIVLLTQPDIEYKYWQQNVKRFLSENDLQVIEVPAFIHRERKYPDSAIGGYLNYLIVGDVLLLPVFDVPGNRDEEAIRLFESLFPKLTVVPIVINSIARAGGLIHCVTWEGELNYDAY